jgi:predicted PurR-regulated permease PerM
MTLWFVFGGLFVILGFVVFFGVFTMATLAQVNASLQAQTEAIQDLEDRIPPPAAATEEDLNAVKAQIDQNTASINSILPAAGTQSADRGDTERR